MATKSDNPDKINQDIGDLIPEFTQPVLAKTINDAESSSQIHHDGNNTYYALNEFEFRTIKNGSDNYWKELSIASWSVFFPLLINTCVEAANVTLQNLSLELFLNSSFTLITFILALVFSFSWHKSMNKVKDVFEKVESKPKFRL